jgi:hypothetical protein
MLFISIIITQPIGIKNQGRKLKSRYWPRNRFQEPSLELSSQATWAGGPVRQPMPTCFLAPVAGLKLPTLSSRNNTEIDVGCGKRATILCGITERGPRPRSQAAVHHPLHQPASAQQYILLLTDVGSERRSCVG